MWWGGSCWYDNRIIVIFGIFRAIIVNTKIGIKTIAKLFVIGYAVGRVCQKNKKLESANLKTSKQILTSFIAKCAAALYDLL